MSPITSSIIHALRNGQLGILADPTDQEDVQKAVLDALTQEREVPKGLDCFSVGNYRQRVVELLKCSFDGLDSGSGIAHRRDYNH